MAPPKATKKSGSQKKEKLFHPQSRKADQLVRAQHRKSKLVDLAKSRKEKFSTQVDIYNFFYSAVPAEGALNLEDLHTIIRDVWLTRFNAELDEERAARRRGRPKSVKEQKMEDLKARELETYRTGMEIIDLTHPKNVELFRRWDQKEAPFVQQLRFIRISSSSPKSFMVSKPGTHPSLKAAAKDGDESHQNMAVDADEDIPLLLEPVERFASTITTMDRI
ncbi:hypothetical protein BDY19DRAFT_885373 [Irpex rosettiformis]|uniref:Uncharacterized protein n=1 Tax=Irpex rosettiformis TaxID=378272 RepID=A0ACB8UBR9_9APHY|nr:hypothetical protein BDY19DRAFT_885373 [Irpex rosettiformis]